MASRGIASRRQAEEMIRAGRVVVDGSVVTELGTKVDPRAAEIRVDGRALRPQAMRYVMLNKPTGYITTVSDERDRRTVMELVPVRERLYPVGRLDRETEGLLLLTNDGEVAHRVTHPRYGLAKEYTVLTPVKPSESVLARVRQGMIVEGRKVVPEEFRLFRETRDGVLLTITVHEGLNRLVRRIMDEAGIPVTRLRRVRVGPLDLGNIAPGTFRDLSPGELTSLLQALRLDRDVASTSPRPVTRGGPLRPPARSARPRAITGVQGPPRSVRDVEPRTKSSGGQDERGGRRSQRAAAPGGDDLRAGPSRRRGSRGNDKGTVDPPRRPRRATGNDDRVTDDSLDLSLKDGGTGDLP